MVVPVAVGGTVFAFACGSSSVHVVRQLGQPARWAALALLFLLALGWAIERWDGVLLPRVVVASTVSFLAVAVVSALWSVDPRLTGERAVSLGILLLTALLLAQACRGRADDVEHAVLGILGGATAVALGGLIVLAADHASSIEPATIGSPTRYQGLGENPDTAALLFAVVLPTAIWMLLTPGTRRRRAAGVATFVLLFASIIASGSRGALFAAGIGALVPAVVWAGRARKAVAACLAVGIVVALGAFFETVPHKNPNAASGAAVTAPAAAAKSSRYVNVENPYPLDADIGRPLPGGGEPWKPRSFFGASGRGVAWTGAIEQLAGRPLLGFGFGTEGTVFVDRYYTFVGGLTENSYIGLGLQVGVVGLLLLLVVIAALIVTGRPALSGLRRGLASACLGVLSAGLAVAVIQSYFYSAGNIAAAALWIAAFMLPALAARAGVRNA